MIITDEQIGEFEMEYGDVKIHEEECNTDNGEDIPSVISTPIQEYWEGRMRSLDRVKEIFGI